MRTYTGRDGMISIHAAREGGDHVGWICGKLGRISIHAAREGGDTGKSFSGITKSNFNPRRP